MKINDTIAAVSTPRGKGGIAVIRISGSEALEITNKIFAPAKGSPISDADRRMAVYGKIYQSKRAGGALNNAHTDSPIDAHIDTPTDTPTDASVDASVDAFVDAPIDDGIAVYFPAPRSFTGEDTVEISCHGGLLVTEAVLSAVLSAGARPAEAGEFTRRAFVNGKMGLSEAEALSNLLEAKNFSQMKLARSGLEGKLQKKCDLIYAELRMILASLYARIDYPDEDLADISGDEMRQRLEAILAEVRTIASTYKSGHTIAEGIKTVICGRPNVGKSSLYNKIVGRDAAIVTDIEGTTRDILEETAALGGVTLRLCDTAGLHRSEDRVEQIGVERAYEKIDEAELILALFDGSSELTDEDREIMELLKEKSDRVVAIINKSELEQKINKEIIAEQFGDIIEISTVSEDGIADLAKYAESKFLDKALDVERDAIVFGARQHASLIKTDEHLSDAINILSLGGESDAASFAVETAMAALAELDGRQVGEDIVSQIFHSFCVGK